MKRLLLSVIISLIFSNCYTFAGYSFQENKGQIRDKDEKIRSEVIFIGEADNYTIYLRKSGWSYVIKSYDSTGFDAVRVDVELQNSKLSFNTDTKHKLPGYDNFIMSGSEFIAKVYSYQEVVYEGIYEGIDLRFYYDEGSLRYDYIVHAGADPKQISMEIIHSDNPKLNNDMKLIIPTILGNLNKDAPYTYQIIENRKDEVKSNYILNGNILSFETGKYDKTKELIIDPVTLVSAKLNRIKSLYRGLNSGGYTPLYYSNSLYYNNIKRLSDNSLILVTNDFRDWEFIDDARFHTRKHFRHYDRYYDFLPAVIYKYNPEGEKEWSTYIYKKYNFVISWDATDSIAAVYSQSYIFYDSTMDLYNKEAVFVSIFDIKSGLLLNRFELEKPEGIKQLKHTYMDGELFLNMDYDPNSNYSASILHNSGFEWNYTKSYEKILYLKDSIISLIALGQYPGNNDTVYDYGLFLQKYNLDGKLTYNHEIKRNKIYLHENKRQVDFSKSDFGYSSVTMDYKTVRFLNDGSFITLNQNMKNKDKYSNFKLQNQCSHEAYYNLYDNAGNLIFTSNQDNDFRFLFEKYYGVDSLKKIPGEGTYWCYDFTIYHIDSSKNIYLTKNLGKNDILWKKYKDRIKVNPYNPNLDKGQPCLMKFDSTGKLLWLSQFLKFPENYSIVHDYYGTSNYYDGEIQSFFDYSLREKTDHHYLDQNESLDDWIGGHGGGGGSGSDESFTPMNTGSELIMSLDSIGNIFIQRFIDSVQYLKHNLPISRRLVVTKLSPDGDVIWQDTTALYMKFNLHLFYSREQAIPIKSSKIFNNELYLDYFVSNVNDIIYLQDSSKYDISDFYPIMRSTDILKNWMNELEQQQNTDDIVYDLITFRFKLDDNKLVSVTPTKIQISDTICVNHETSFKVEVHNEWHSQMEFEPPHLKGEGFRIVPNGAFTLQAGEKKEFTIIFAPKQHKVHTGSVVFKQNTISDFSHTVEFRGLTKAVIIETDLVWDLGPILLNNTASGIFRIYNNGNVDSWIQAIKDLPEPFKQISPEFTSNFIKAGEFLDYTIEFTPTVAGTFEYKYKIYAGTGCPDTLEILIKGKGVTESIVIDSDSLDFGYLYFCENKTDTISIENVTNLPLTYNSAQITGLNADNFTIHEKPNDGEILIRGNSAKFVIEFKPLTPYGNKSAILEINTSEKTLNCPLKGEYTEVDITVNDIDMGIRNLNVIYDTVLTIQNNTRDNVTLLSVSPTDNRVIISTVLPLEIKAFSSENIDIEFNSSIITPINSKINFEISAKCSTILISNIKCNFDSSKAEISGIDFGKVPYCEERIDSIRINNTGNSPVQVTEISFIKNDGSFEFVDNMILPIELLSGQFIAVAVRYLSQGKIASQNTAKVRATLMFDGSEQNFDVEIKGQRIIPELEYLTEIDFGRLKPGEMKNINFEIKNIGEEVEISEVKTILSNFSILTFSDLIQKNEKGLINLSFSSEIIGEYSDEMTVYFSLGKCEDSIKISLKVDVSRLMTIWANHHTVGAGTKGFEVPIFAETDLGAQISGKQYKLEISYLPELYYNVSVSKAQILSKSRDGSYERLVIEAVFPEITSSETVLFHLKGDVLFSPRMTTPIEVKFIESTASLSVTTRDGSLTLDSLCQVPIRGIQPYTPTRMTLSPNPSDGELKVSIGTQEQGSFSLIVFDVQGREVYRSEFTKSNKTFEQKDYNINTQNLGNGIYTIHLTAPWTLLREQVVVVR